MAPVSLSKVENKMADLMQGAIPGQSLTDLPKNSPWEKPSELSEVKDVVKYYVERLADDEVMDDLTVVFELGGDLQTVTETICLTGSMKGMHTVEAGMLAGPVVASFIKAAMKTYGIDTPETIVSTEKKSETREFSRLMALVNKAREEDGTEDGDEDAGGMFLGEMEDVLQDETGGTEPPADDAIMPEEAAPKTGEGLMSRGVL